MFAFLQSLTRFRDLGVLILRLAFGFQLVKASWPYATNPAENFPQFEQYLTSLGFPLPGVGVYLSTYTEFLGGILFLLGLWTRPAALLIAINFLAAFFMAHIAISDTYQNTFPSANLVAVSLFLLFNGAGKYSVDARLGNA